MLDQQPYLVILAEGLLHIGWVLLLHMFDRIDGQFESLAADVALIAVSGSVDAPLVLAGVPENRRRDNLLCFWFVFQTTSARDSQWVDFDCRLGEPIHCQCGNHNTTCAPEDMLNYSLKSTKVSELNPSL